MRMGLNILILLFLIALFFFYEYSQQSRTAIVPVPQPTIHPTSVLAANVNSNSLCHNRGVLPDPACTPGSVDPRVTQENINQTICVRGYTKTVRPPLSYTNDLKIKQIAQYGYTDTNLHDYEEDHLISLELGGDPKDPKNLWPELGASPNAKDQIENLCHDKVCTGQISLAEAQKEISTNWQTACP